MLKVRFGNRKYFLKGHRKFYKVRILLADRNGLQQKLINIFILFTTKPRRTDHVLKTKILRQAFISVTNFKLSANREDGSCMRQ
jgi:hypothetical protein